MDGRVWLTLDNINSQVGQFVALIGGNYFTGNKFSDYFYSPTWSTLIMVQCQMTPTWMTANSDALDLWIRL